MVVEALALAGIDPITGLLAFGLVSSLAGTTVSAISSFQAGRQQERAAEQAEALAARNAEILKARGEKQAALRRREARRFLAQQRAAAAGSGVEVGSFIDLLSDQAREEEEAARTIEQGFTMESQLERQRGRLTSRNLRARSRQTILGGTTNFLSGLGSVAITAGTTFGRPLGQTGTEART